jgi:hypothetical protein
MATWKRLTRTSGPQVDVNIDAILHMQRHQDKHTTLHFSVAVGDKIHFLWVKETPDEIHSRPPQQARGI